MKTIYKYQLQITDTQGVEMPKGAEILKVEMQNTACLWALVDTSKEIELREICIFGTGNPIPNNAELKHISTFQVQGGLLIFHAFERLK